LKKKNRIGLYWKRIVILTLDPKLTYFTDPKEKKEIVFDKDICIERVGKYKFKIFHKTKKDFTHVFKCATV
jgi:hypothetical protein